MEFRYTQNIIIRIDLKMSKGKMCAQACHASILASEAARHHHRQWWKRWMEEGQRKVVLKVGSLEELMALKAEAERLGIPMGLVQDMGFTELPPGTITCLGLGPAPTELVDKVTGKLPLL
ncbi:MAG: peptidyl-tRNA hydrolase Pth2 [Candidatus Bathyarchaeia archaeon]